jgi:methyl-accepting chemotaxis protein
MLLPSIAIALVVLAGCENKSAIEKAQDRVNDALDRRPHEELRDAAEEISGAAKDVGSAVKDAAHDVAEHAQDAAADVAADAKKTARKLND